MLTAVPGSGARHALRAALAVAVGVVIVVWHLRRGGRATIKRTPRGQVNLTLPPGAPQCQGFHMFKVRRVRLPALPRVTGGGHRWHATVGHGESWPGAAAVPRIRRLGARGVTVLIAAAAITAVATLLPTAQAFASASPGTARAATPVHAQDARAVAKPTAAANQASWFSGTVAPGGVQEWIWHNTNHSQVYVPGLDPQGTATNVCQFQVTKTWYVEQPGGATEFHFDIQNIGTFTCGTNILLSWLSSAGSFSSGGISAGQTVTGEWFNNPDLAVFQVGLVPAGATSANACRIQISNLRYSQVGGSARTFLFDLTNTGGIACAATILIGHVQASGGGFNELPAGASIGSGLSFNAPPNLVFIAGAEGTSNGCQLQVTKTSYAETNPPAEQEFDFIITNIGSVSCNAETLVAWIS